MIHFYSYISRMKHIKRWGLMKNTEQENIKEHSFDVAVTAHALALIGNTYFNKNNDVHRILELALFHETSEVITGDLATPIKYFNPQIKKSFSQIDVYKRQVYRNLKKQPRDFILKEKPYL